MADESVEQVVERLESEHSVLFDLGMCIAGRNDAKTLAVVFGYGKTCYLAGQQAERERCAKIADDEIYHACGKTGHASAQTIAAAIRKGE